MESSSKSKGKSKGKQSKKKSTQSSHQQSGRNDSSDQFASVPRDAKTMALILNSMGFSKYSPLVITQLLELMYRYVSDILTEASVYSHHGGRKDLNIEDIRLATVLKTSNSFLQPPSREVFLQLAVLKNSVPLPPFKSKTPQGVQLPPRDQCLSGINFQFCSTGKRKAAEGPQPQPEPQQQRQPPQQTPPQTSPQTSSQPQIQPPQQQPHPPAQPQSNNASTTKEGTDQ